MERIPVFGIERHRLTTDGQGVTTLVGTCGCPLQCKYCINPHAWNPATLERSTYMSPQELYERVKVDNLYFLASGGGITFGGGESLLYAEFIKAFRKVCGAYWRLTVETSLHVRQELLEAALECVDDFIVDIKDMNPDIYKAYTGKENGQVLVNLRLLASRLGEKQVRVRVPAIPEFNEKTDVQASMEKLKKLGFQDIEVFPYIVREA